MRGPSSGRLPSDGAASRARLNIALLGVAALVGFAFLARPLWWYATGTPAHAMVERCDDPGRKPLVCTGTWTLPDGTRHRGRIAGVGKGDAGETLRVRASASHAAAFTLRLLYGPGLVLLVAAVFGYVTYRQRAGVRRGATSAQPAERGQDPPT